MQHPSNIVKGIDVDLPRSEEEVLLLHNPQCSKSRATLALLEGRGVTFSTRLYLDEPLSRDELGDLGQRLGRSAIEFTRTGQAEFSEAGLTKSSGDEDLFAAMAARPILMERPVVVRGKRAVVGRPPEDVLALFEG
jgi:arsenate reductase (glutaredoxin)